MTRLLGLPQYEKVLYLLEPTDLTRTLRRKTVTVVTCPDGRLAIRHGGIDLPYSRFDKLRQVSQAAVVENKRLGAVLLEIREAQLRDSGPASKRHVRHRLPGEPRGQAAV